MNLMGIEFGKVLDGSGVRGFLGEGYPHHRLLRRVGLDLAGSTFVSKTVTLDPRVGWLPYKADQLTPAELFPRCVVIKWRRGVVLNAVGLGNPGLEWLLASGRWQDWLA